MIVGDFPVTPDKIPKGVTAIVWVVYDHPKNFPGGYVARPEFVMEDDKIVPYAEAVWMHEDLAVIRGGLASSGKFCLSPDRLETQRDALVEGELTCLARKMIDDPEIVEMWL